MKNNLPIFSIELNELEETSGIDLISVVDHPAIESNFIKLEGDAMPLMLASDKAKQYVTGPVLIPEKLVFRKGAEQDFYIKFSADNIEKMRNKFFKSGQLKLSNLDHSKEDQIQGFLIESWIVEDEKMDKAVALGFTDVKKGSLYCTYHFPDETTWKAVSERNGFSVELHKMKPVMQLSAEPEGDTVESLLEDLLNALGK